MERESFCLLPVTAAVRRITALALTATTGVLRLTGAVSTARTAWISTVETTRRIGTPVAAGTLFVLYVNNYLKYKQ